MRIFTLRNEHGLEARIADFGGILLSLRVPDRRGRLEDVVLGFDSPADYVAGNEPYFGALIGRVANRIGRGRFRLDGRTVTLATNEPPHHLHGGRRGFDRVFWEVESTPDDGGDSVILRHTSPDGDEGYPGTLQARVRYALTERDELVVDFRATTDRATPVNLTHHSYFSLAGPGASDVLDHVLTLPADRFTPIDATLLPTGELRPVEGTPFDFRSPKRIGAAIRGEHAQLRLAGGFDHNYVLGPAGEDGLRVAARLEDPGTGRTLEVRTTEPGLQLYTGNGLGGVVGKGGARYRRHAGVALETQHFPDSPNQEHFPSTILRPGETFQSRTLYAFGTLDD